MRRFGNRSYSNLWTEIAPNSKKARWVAPPRLIKVLNKLDYLPLCTPMSTGAGAGAGFLEAQEARVRAAVASTRATRVDFMMIMLGSLVVLFCDAGFHHAPRGDIT